MTDRELADLVEVVYVQRRGFAIYPCMDDQDPMVRIVFDTPIRELDFIHEYMEDRLIYSHPDLARECVVRLAKRVVRCREQILAYLSGADFVLPTFEQRYVLAKRMTTEDVIRAFTIFES